MATKTKETKESAPKTSSPVPAQKEKGGAKTLKKLVTDKKLTSVVDAKTDSKTKQQPQAVTSEPSQETAPEPTEQAAPQTAPVVGQDQKWQEIRLTLEKLKEDTLREIRKSVKNGTEAVAAIEPGGDIYDQASSERDRELGLILGDREREKIHSIDEALLRIDEGDYGICEECDEDIPLGRLKAMPFTRHCVKCKSDLEKLQAQTKRVEEERAYREIPLGSEEEE
jgi:DnaK suppressor protein